MHPMQMHEGKTAEYVYMLVNVIIEIFGYITAAESFQQEPSMKTGIATAVIALVMPVCVFATTLRLTTDIDLLVLDGKKCPVPCCAVRTASNLIMGHTSWYCG